MSDDAVFVYCNITGSGETCVFPDMHSSHMPNIPWRKEGDKNDWYSNLRGGFRVSIGVKLKTVNSLGKIQHILQGWLSTTRNSIGRPTHLQQQ
jgi:hypothetical protein